jgi:dTDP-4-dehydrorhamnose reductase
MSALVLGASGQLGRHLRDLMPNATFWTRAEADLAEPASLERAIATVRPSIIVNAAAYTAVDRAESEPDLAWRVNAEAPAALARAAGTQNAKLIHVSTDFVFDGQNDRPYRETDPVGPINMYGRSKLGGELAVQSLCPRHWIIRTSWVFSEFGSNFVKTMLRLARERDELRVVDDQRGCPTYAGDLARLIHRLALDPNPAVLPFGIHHACGGPVVSWRGFAETIVEAAVDIGLLPRRVPVIAIATHEYPTAARRPRNSALEPSPLLARLEAVPFDWKAGLDGVLRHLKGAVE